MRTKSHCRECEAAFSARRLSDDFCGTECRKAFNNRRMQRGAVLYDLMMMQAHAPDVFERMRLEPRIAGMLAHFRAQDESVGRARSWKRAETVMIDTAIYAHPPHYSKAP